MGEKIFKGGVILFLLMFIFIGYAIVAGINDRSEVQADRITAVEGDVKEMKTVLKGTATKDDLVKVVADDAREDGARIVAHEHSSYHRAPARHKSQVAKVPPVVAKPAQQLAEAPKVQLPKVGDPCPYGVVSVSVSIDGSQNFICGPVPQPPQQVAIREPVREPAPRDDFYDRVQYVPRRVEVPIQPQQAPRPEPVRPQQEASSGTNWVPWAIGAALVGWYVNAHRNRGATGFAPTVVTNTPAPTVVTNGVGAVINAVAPAVVTNGVGAVTAGVNPVGVIGGPPTVTTQ